MLPELEGRTDEDTGILEFTDEETAPVGKCGVMKPVIDIAQDPPALVFTDWPEPELPEPSESDAVTGDEFLSMVEDVL